MAEDEESAAKLPAAELPGGDEHIEGRTIADVVADLGFGPAQVFVMLLSSAAVLFCDGMALSLTNLVTESTGKDFNLSHEQRASLPMVTLSGVMVGSLAAGSFGDVLGRRFPTMWSVLFTAVLGLFCALAPDYPHLLIGRAFFGAAMGLGLPPSVAMTSEVCPEEWRIVMRTCSNVAFTMGGLFVTLLAAFDDPNFHTLHWRRLLALSSIPPLVWWVLQQALLSESPVFLASCGRHAEARAAFVRLKGLNSRPDVSVYYSPEDAASPRVSAGTSGFFAGYKKALSPKYRYATLALFLSSLCFNLVSYGDSYAAPQVLSEDSRMPKAWTLVIKSSLSVCMCAFTGFVASVLSRKQTVLIALVACIVATVSFAYAGPRLGQHSAIVTFLYAVGAHGSVIGCSAGFITVFQMSVEIYPTQASTAGGAIVMGGGRLAAVFAPFIFERVREWTGQWASFYLLMAGSCCFVIMLVGFMEPPQPYRPGTAHMAKVDFPSYGAVPAAQREVFAARTASSVLGTSSRLPTLHEGREPE